MSKFSTYSKFIPYFYLFAFFVFITKAILEMINGGEFGIPLILSIAAIVMFYIKRRMYLKHYKK